MKEEVNKPIIVLFREIGYETFKFSINTNKNHIDFTLHNKSIDDIEDILYRFCEAYEIERDSLEFYTSSENFFRINQRTLSNAKTVWELFDSRNILIKELTYQYEDKGE